MQIQQPEGNQDCPRYALLSVSDKSGITDLARDLIKHGYHLLSTGGTFKHLQQAGLKPTEVSALTEFPEIMDGRVKTLHPRIHGGLLGRRGIDERVMADHQIPLIDILVLNLYPFEATVAQPDCSLQDAIENIDIGGPAMLRAAAKNHASVAVVTDPGQYPEFIRLLAAEQLDSGARFNLAVEAFNHVARYDAAISSYLSALDSKGHKSVFPGQTNGCFTKVADLRYGENPHQQAAWYQDLSPAAGSLATARQHQGKALSFNNLADADAAWDCVRQFDAAACVIVKHANPCGIGIGGNILDAYEKAFATDTTSAFGGIIAFNQALDQATASSIIQRQFLELLIAPSFSQEALKILNSKPNIRVLEIALAPVSEQQDMKRIGSGILLQTADNAQVSRDDCRVVTRITPDDQQWTDLLFAWKAVKFVKSNAIVFARDGQTLGIGAGQMSRVDSTRIARWKAGDAGFDVSGAVMASDAFFPFRDGIDNAAEAGIKAIIQPGGSMRDQEVIDAADEHGISMVFTGIRHFRH